MIHSHMRHLGGKTRSSSFGDTILCRTLALNVRSYTDCINYRRASVMIKIT